MDDAEKTFLSTMATNFEKMRDCQVLTDVTITVGRLSFPAHKLVLCSHSHYFAAMFTTSSMIEKNMNEIEIKQELSPPAVEKILLYMYNGKIDLTEEVEEIFRASQYLQVDAVSDLCLTAMSEDISLIKFQLRSDLLAQHGKEETRKILIQNLAQQFVTLYPSEEFLFLSADHLKELLSFTDSKKYCKEVFMAVLTWLKHDVVGRKSEMKHFVRYLKVKKAFPASFLIQLLEKGLFWEVPELGNQVSAEVVRKFWIRQPTIYVLEVMTNDKFRVQMFDPDVERWKPASSVVPIPFANSVIQVRDVFSCKSKIFFVLPTKICVLNVETNVWDSSIFFTSPCSSKTRGTCYNDDNIVIVDSRSIQYFNLNSKEQRWKEFCSFPIFTDVKVKAVVTLNGFLILICSNPNILHYFQLSTREWLTITLKHPYNLTYCNYSTLYLMDSKTYKLSSIDFSPYLSALEATAHLKATAVTFPRSALEAKCFFVDSKNSFCYVVDSKGSIRKFNFQRSRWQKGPVWSPTQPIQSFVKKDAFSVVSTVHDHYGDAFPAGCCAVYFQ